MNLSRSGRAQDELFGDRFRPQRGLNKLMPPAPFTPCRSGSPPLTTKSVRAPYPLIRLPAINEKPSKDWAEAPDTCCPELCCRTHVCALGFSLFAENRNAALGRDKWKQADLADGTVRLENRQTKPDNDCVVNLKPNLIVWLKWADAYGRLNLADDQRSFTRVRVAAGFEDCPVNAIRYTGLSFMLKRLGSIADTAMAEGNSEKKLGGEHYVGRVSAADTERLFSLWPM
jgi:hypothetical protein